MAKYLVKIAENTFTVIILTVLLTNVYAAKWSCSQNATKTSVDVEKMAGIWYEAARIPQSDVPSCVKVTAPSVFVNNDYTLQLDYVNNVNKGWKWVKENLTFPLDTVKQNGTFELTYSGGNTTVVVDFQYMGTLSNITLVCGYSGVASGISMLRLLTRNETVDKNTISTVETLLTSQGIDTSEITWVEQGGRCNGGSYLSSSTLAVLLAFCMVCLQQFINIKR